MSNAECNSCSKCTGLEFIRERLILWTIHAHIAYCPIFGDTIDTFKVLIFDQLIDKHVMSEITLNKTSHGLECRIYDHIDADYNSQHNKVVCLQPENLDCSILNHKVAAPLPLDVITDKYMCIRPNDVILHPLITGVEIDYEIESMSEQQTLLYPFEIENQDCVCVRHLATELYSMYTNGCKVSNFKQSWLQEQKGMVVGMTGVLPAQMVDAVAEFLAESYIEPMDSNVISLVMS